MTWIETAGWIGFTLLGLDLTLGVGILLGGSRRLRLGNSFEDAELSAGDPRK